MRQYVDLLFGGINMSWIKVIVFAVVTAVMTAMFLIVPVFFGTSFYMNGYGRHIMTVTDGDKTYI